MRRLLWAIGLPLRLGLFGILVIVKTFGAILFGTTLDGPWFGLKDDFKFLVLGKYI